jgi:hypothetical protein
MSLRHNHVATGTNDAGSQVSVDRWNEDHVIDAELTLPNVATPVTPDVDKLNLFARKIGGRMMLAQSGPSGLDTTFQPNLGGNKVALWMPPGATSTVPGVFGMNTLTGIGTATSRAIATTNQLARMTRLGYVSAATAGSLAGVRETTLKYTTGAGVGLGGFFARYRFAPSDAANVAGARMFVGLSPATAAPTNVEISTLLNCVGVGQLATSNNLHIYGAGATVGTAVDLGAGFPANGNAVAYELAMFSPSTGEVFWQVTRLDTGALATGQFAAVPIGTVLMCHQLWRTNNATALAVGIDVCGIYIETDY